MESTTQPVRQRGRPRLTDEERKRRKKERNDSYYARNRIMILNQARSLYVSKATKYRKWEDLSEGEDDTGSVESTDSIRSDTDNTA